MVGDMAILLKVTPLFLLLPATRQGVKYIAVASGTT